MIYVVIVVAVIEILIPIIKVGVPIIRERRGKK